jgi:ABC-type glycerol-3-phosphate transport system permease component
MASSIQSVATRRPALARPYRAIAWPEVAAHAGLIAVVLVSIYPLLVMLLNSFKSDSEVLRNPAGWPIAFTLESYVNFLTYQNFQSIRSFANSVFIATVSTLLSVALTGLAAFVFAKLRFRGRELVFALLLGTLMVPGEVTLPPLYVMFASIGWLNSYQVQIVPGIASVFGLFMIRQYMLTIPDALLDAARVDGASPWQQFWRIIAPISSPVLGAFAILHFVQRWNDYLWPRIVVTSAQVQPIMTLLPDIRDPTVGFFIPWGMVMAGCVLVTLPLIIVFLLFQDRFLAGVVVGATKE